MTTFSIRCSEEQKKRLHELLANHATGEEKADFLLKSAVNSIDACISKENEERLHAVNTNLQQENERLQKEIEKQDLYATELQEIINTHESQNRNLSAVNADLEMRLQEMETRVQDVNNGKNLTFEVPEPANSLLREYARRLQVQPQDILIDMFVRYVTEQYNHWFFDFVVKKSEFKEVCGHSHTEVLTWLNEQK